MDAYQRGVAAILAKVGAGSNMVCGHKEYAPKRKTDPSFDMAAFRREVADLLQGKTPRPPIPAVDDKARRTIRRGDRGDDVKQAQAKLKIKADGIFGSGTEAKMREFQRAKGLVGDGIVGPKTWAALDAA